MLDCTQDDQRGSLRGSAAALLATFGKLVTELPDLHRVIRVNNIGFTLPSIATAVLPFYPDDFFIGRVITDGVASVSDLILYRREMVGDVEHFLYIDTRTLPTWNSNQISNHYTYASSSRNYHALWFRSAIEEYKSKNVWRADLPKAKADLEELYKTHLHLGRKMKIPRFSIELENLRDFYNAIGLFVPVNTCDKFQGYYNYA